MFVARVKNVQVGAVQITYFSEKLLTCSRLARFQGQINAEHITTKTTFSEEMHRLIGKKIIVSPFPEGASPWDTEWYIMRMEGCFIDEEEYVFHSSWLDFEKSKTRYQILKEQNL